MSSRDPDSGGPTARVALVTVGDSGVGRAIAQRLAEAGTTVYVGARSESGGRAAEQASRAEGFDVRAVPLDLDDGATVARAAALVERDWGRLDVLVSMIGLSMAFHQATDPAAYDARAVFEANTIDALHLMTVANAMLPLLRRSTGGRVVHVCSGFDSVPPGGGSAARSSTGVAVPVAVDVNAPPRTSIEALTLRYADAGRSDCVLVNAVRLPAEICDWDGAEGTRALLRAAALPVGLALLADGGPTATSTGPDGVCTGLVADTRGDGRVESVIRIV